MLIIPAIDLRDGRCVRLQQGDYGKEQIYSDHPTDVAAGFAARGASLIHVVDLDGAREGHPINLDALTSIVSEVAVPIQFGGGVRSEETVAKLLGLGVERVVVGTLLIREPDLARRLFATFGERVVGGLDSRGGNVAVAGWEESSNVDAIGLALSLAGAGCKRIVATDIETDGMETGPNIELLRKFRGIPGLSLIASGGVGTLDHLRQLREVGLEGAIIGKALYEGRFTLKEAIATVSSPNR